MKETYIHGPGIDEPLMMNRDNKNYFYHTDGLGSVVGLSNDLGEIEQQYLYTSFGGMTVFNKEGSEIQSVDGIKNPYGYTGREMDTESDLYFYRARYYNPEIGRWMQKDPIGFAGGDTNLYRYVGNNPVNFIDPTGTTSYPTDDGRVTGNYGPRTSPFSGFHSGVDFGQRGTSGNVYAPESGYITNVSQTSRGTNYMTLLDGNGNTHGFYHTSTLLQSGAYVNEGQPIGFSDMSGRSTGLHLHYTIQTGAGRNTRINPMNYLYGNGATTPVNSCGGR